VALFATVPASANAATLHYPLPILPKIDAVQIDEPLNSDGWKPFPQKVEPLAQTEYYGRQLLVQSGETKILNAYDAIVKGVSAFETKICLESRSCYGWNCGYLTRDEAFKAIAYVQYDHPELFWFGDCSVKRETVSSMLDGEHYHKTYVTYTLPMPKDEIIDLQNQLKDRVAELISGLEYDHCGHINGRGKLVEKDVTPRDRVRTLFERLCTSAEYDHTLALPHTYDLVGVLLNGTGVCESYAEAYQYLMHRVGIQCIPVVGTYGVADGTNHKWCMVNLDGQWLMVDPTGGSNPNGLQYKYLNFAPESMYDLGYTDVEMKYDYFPFDM